MGRKHLALWVIVLLTSTACGAEPLKVCSFNIQFLGFYKSRDDESLASLLAPYDLVVIQELTAPPIAGVFPDGEPYKPDSEAAEFFRAMRQHGFDYLLSPEDTGKNETIHSYGSNTEWWVVFYKPSRLTPADDLPSGFLGEDRSAHPDWGRVPYAFPFRSGAFDFVVINVHLQPGSSSADRQRRRHEIASIASWIDRVDESEKDFLIVGDMNIHSKRELADALPPGFKSLNDECRNTTTSKTYAPYDHIFYRPEFTTEIDEAFDMKVIDLVDAMKPPGYVYDHNSFRMRYSDHQPVLFQLVPGEVDDD